MGGLNPLRGPSAALAARVSFYGAHWTAASNDWISSQKSAAALATIDVFWARTRSISRISLLDATFELALLIGLVIAWWMSSHATL